MRTPSDCRDLSEIREEVDRIDRALIDLLGRRWSTGRGRALQGERGGDPEPGLPAGLLDRRRSWAEAAGLAPDYVESVFRTIAEASIADQLRRWRAGRPAE